MNLSYKINVSFFLLMTGLILSDFFMINKIHKDNTVKTMNVFLNRINGDADTIIPHLYQIGNFPHLRRIFKSYEKLGISCLQIRDMNKTLLYGLATDKCSMNVIAKNYLDQPKLIISFDFPPLPISSTLNKYKNILFSVFPTQFIIIIIFLILFKKYLNLKSEIEIEINKTKTDAQIKEQLSEQAKQLAHDIRSPLAALNMALKDLSGVPEFKRTMIRGSVNRIHDIANNILDKNRIVAKVAHSNVVVNPIKSENSNTMVLSILDDIITEKRIQFREKIGIGLEYEPDSSAYGLFANINISNFKRVISNLINNSYEALEESGKIQVVLNGLDGKVNIEIADNGVGIPSHILNELGKEGFSHGKENGNGLGIYHAKKIIEQLNGKFEIESKHGSGVKITISLPTSQIPFWFVPEITIHPEMKIIILDDDLSIHQIWQNRFESEMIEKSNIKFFHLSSTESLREYLSQNKNENANELFLIDFELLGQKTTGLDLIEEFKIAHKSILVTSRFEELDIVNRCLKYKLGLIPKTIAALVPISINTCKTKNNLSVFNLS